MRNCGGGSVSIGRASSSSAECAPGDARERAAIVTNVHILCTRPVFLSLREGGREWPPSGRGAKWLARWFCRQGHTHRIAAELVRGDEVLRWRVLTNRAGTRVVPVDAGPARAITVPPVACAGGTTSDVLYYGLLEELRRWLLRQWSMRVVRLRELNLLRLRSVRRGHRLFEADHVMDGVTSDKLRAETSQSKMVAFFCCISTWSAARRLRMSALVCAAPPRFIAEGCLSPQWFVAAPEWRLSAWSHHLREISRSFLELHVRRPFRVCLCGSPSGVAQSTSRAASSPRWRGRKTRHLRLFEAHPCRRAAVSVQEAGNS